MYALGRRTIGRCHLVGRRWRLVSSIAALRTEFLNFFEGHGHTRVPSSSLLPFNDPSLLFVNAGMVPFKDVFLGRDRRPYDMATSAQRCLRVGGKHNDLEHVGRSLHHHTFFEMLGNFSFGSYFKDEAIRLAWTFLTTRLGLDPTRLCVTVLSSDEESVHLWKTIASLPDDRILRRGTEENWWSMGHVGPCGPCSEIFYDLRNEGHDMNRWLEIWNLVFMQYDRRPDGSCVPLPTPGIDTGMGLERIAQITQGHTRSSSYEIDIFAHLLRKACELVHRRSGVSVLNAATDPGAEASALRVITDHLRAVSFLVSDGVIPSSVGRGYVLRRLIRRAVRVGHRVGLLGPFFSDLFPSLVDVMGDTNPELSAQKDHIMGILTGEEMAFGATLENGMKVLERAMLDARTQPSRILSAEVAFQLHDSYGFPLDLTILLAGEEGLTVDEEGYKLLMDQQRTRARTAWIGSGDVQVPEDVRAWQEHEIFPLFVGHEPHLDVQATLVGVAPTERDVWLALDPCPFYPEGGGQVGDQGVVILPDGRELSVVDTQQPYEGGFALRVSGWEGQEVLADEVRPFIGSRVRAIVDKQKRDQCAIHHTATHLLHSALKRVLAENGVVQAGSRVDSHHIRFDFAYPRRVRDEELRTVESWVNECIEANIKVVPSTMTYDRAVSLGAVRLFTERYGDVVRVVEIGDQSVELCGGTHVASTGCLFPFKIITESSIATGTRRIEAVAGRRAVAWLQSQYEVLQRLLTTLGTTATQVEDRLARMQQDFAEAKRSLRTVRTLYTTQDIPPVATVTINGCPVHVHALSTAQEPELLRLRANALQALDSDSTHLLFSETHVMVISSSLDARNLLDRILEIVGGSGGGNATRAQGKLTTPNTSTVTTCRKVAERLTMPKTT